MPTKQLFFGNDQRSGDEQLAGAPPLAVNVVIDGKGAVRRRPGVTAWAESPDLGEPIIGMHVHRGYLYFVTESRRVWRNEYTAAGAFIRLWNMSTGGLPSMLEGTERPTFALTPWRMAIAGGGAPLKVENAQVLAEPLGGSPPDSKHIVALSQRLISDDQTDVDSVGSIRWSFTGDAGTEDWDPLNFTNAEARPDPVVSIRENGSELFAFGSTSLQIYSPDSTLILAPGRALNRGCAAGHSVINGEESLAWLTSRREFVQSDGRAVSVLSNPIAATLDQITEVSNCYGFRYAADQFDCLCWQMPTDGRTFVIQEGGGWAQWHGWTQPLGFTLFPIESFFYWEERNLHLVGRADGTVGYLDSTATTDEGETIKAEVLTGFITNGTDAWKNCESIRLTFQRGEAAGPDEPVVLLSWRDSLGAFCDPIPLSLGISGDHIFTIERRSLGMYRARQWKIEFTEAVDFVLARAEETFSIGGNN